jgi:hypothetical protein
MNKNSYFRNKGFLENVFRTPKVFYKALQSLSFIGTVKKTFWKTLGNGFPF